MAKLSAGDWVEVRSKEEILRTLDKSGRMQGLPFMPQMFKDRPAVGHFPVVFRS